MCWPRQPRQAREKFMKSSWTCCSSHYLHPSTTSCHLLFCPSFQFRLLASTPSLLPSHSPQFLYFSCSSSSASAVPRGYETVLETRCMCHGLSPGDEHPLMVRGLFILLGRATLSHTAAASYTYCIYVNTYADFLLSKLQHFSIIATCL